jgi:hypothetical protein
MIPYDNAHVSGRKFLIFLLVYRQRGTMKTIFHYQDVTAISLTIPGMFFIFRLNNRIFCLRELKVISLLCRS